jgi:CheY-like chemotaxis protein
MQSIIQFFNDTGWLANLIGIATFIGGGAAVFFRFLRPRFLSARIDKVVSADLDRKWDDSRAKEIAKIAIVDDQPADFPTTELKSNGYHVQTYRQVTLSTTAQLASYDIVFLDMKGVVKDDPENGGLKLIAELRRLSPAQKICAVSSKTFDINATEFFRQADDAKKKPLTAHECRAVITTFLGELFSAKVLRESVQQAMRTLPRERRVEVVMHLRKFTKGEMTIEQLRETMPKVAGDPALGQRLVNVARVVAHAGK